MKWLFAVLLLCSFAWADCPAGYTQRFYVDFVGGNDANNGTSTATPWKLMFGMKGFAGAGYAHTNGTCWILKGGVTWPPSVLALLYTVGSTTSVPDYIGVDQTWFTGGAWSRPILDGGYTTLGQSFSNNGSVVMLGNTTIGSSNSVTFDNIEVAHLLAPQNNGPALVYAFPANTGRTILVENAYIHGWKLPTYTISSASCSGSTATVNFSSPVSGYNVGTVGIVIYNVSSLINGCHGGSSCAVSGNLYGSGAVTGTNSGSTVSWTQSTSCNGFSYTSGGTGVPSDDAHGGAFSPNSSSLVGSTQLLDALVDNLENLGIPASFNSPLSGGTGGDGLAIKGWTKIGKISTGTVIQNASSGAQGCRGDISATMNNIGMLNGANAGRFDGLFHTNGWYCVPGPQNTDIHDSVMSNIGTGTTFYVKPCEGTGNIASGRQMRLYNDVYIQDANHINGVAPFVVDPEGATNNCGKVFLLNNTAVYSSGTGNCVGTVTRSGFKTEFLYADNNQCVTNPPGGLIAASPNVIKYTDGGHNIVQSISSASSQGFLASNNFQIPSSATSVYNTGTSLLTGTVNTSGTGVTWVSGAPFLADSSWNNATITINGLSYTISSVTDWATPSTAATITLTSSAGTQTGVPYSIVMSSTVPAVDLLGVSRPQFSIYDASAYELNASPPFTLSVAFVQGMTGAGTVTTGDGNINCGVTCSFQYAAGAQPVFTATPSSGTFMGWGGAGSGSSNPYTFTMPAHDATVIADFELVPVINAFTASPTILNSGNNVTFTFSASSSQQCSLTDGSGVGYQPTTGSIFNGTVVTAPLLSQTFTYSCASGQQSAQSQITIQVNYPISIGGSLSISK